MQSVDSGALSSVGKSLQLSEIGSPTTDFDDANLQQVLDVSGLVRRGLTILDGRGWWAASMSNVHAGAGDESLSINPYSVGSGSAQNGYPESIDPAVYDVWLIGAMRLFLSAAATFTGCALDIVFQQGRAFGSAGNGAFPVHVWDGSVTPITGSVFGTIAGTGSATGPMLAVRIPPNGLLRLRSLSTGILTVDAQMALGVFPAGLGQDAIGAG